MFYLSSQRQHTVSNFSKILRIADQNDIAVLMYTLVSVSALIAVSLLIFSIHLYRFVSYNVMCLFIFYSNIICHNIISRKKTSKELLIGNSRESFDIGIGNDLQSIKAKGI